MATITYFPAAGSGGGTVANVDSPLAGDGSSGDHLRLLSANWLTTQQTRAIAFKSTLTFVAHDIPWGYTRGAGVDYTIAVGGSGTTATGTGLIVGGGIQLDTGATGSSSAAIHSPPASQLILANPSATPFYCVTRALIQAGVDAVSQHGVLWLFDNSAQWIYLKLDGAVSQTHLTLSINNASETVLTSTDVVDTSAAHDYAIGFDGTTVTCFQDGVPIAGLSTAVLTNMPANPVTIEHRVLNQGTAASRKMRIQRDILFTAPM